MASHSSIGFRPAAAAFFGNLFVTVIKFTAASISGSSAMFSEAVHSLADTLNQVLLLIGLRRSLKKADDNFEYGYGNELSFWALISACGIFFVGAGVTGYRGVSAFLHPHEIEFSPLVFIVLIVALVVESYTLWVAASQLRKSFPQSKCFSQKKPCKILAGWDIHLNLAFLKVSSQTRLLLS